ncbi:hypothetical protein [Dinoroseobacter sp. S124A]|uniref:hypothetical protein n=1 Tax=Dinoroseobacter sp. S124A TaxID=3415128 RepID=UPI003C7D2CAB
MEILIVATLLLIYGHLANAEWATELGMGILFWVGLGTLLVIGVFAFLVLT